MQIQVLESARHGWVITPTQAEAHDARQQLLAVTGLAISFASLFVFLAWVLFRADSLSHAAAMLRAMAGFGSAGPLARGAPRTMRIQEGLATGPRSLDDALLQAPPLTLGQAAPDSEALIG